MGLDSNTKPTIKLVKLDKALKLVSKFQPLFFVKFHEFFQKLSERNLLFTIMYYVFSGL